MRHLVAFFLAPLFLAITVPSRCLLASATPKDHKASWPLPSIFDQLFHTTTMPEGSSSSPDTDADFSTGHRHHHVRRAQAAAAHSSAAPSSPPTPTSPPPSSSPSALSSWAGVVYAYYFQRPSALPPSDAISLLQDQGITKYKIFGIDTEVLDAIVSEGGDQNEVTVVLPNEELANLGDPAYADEVVGRLALYKGMVRTIGVGNGPENTNMSDYDLGDQLPRALRNLQASIARHGFNGTTLTVPFTPMILDGDLLAPSNVTIKARYSYAVGQVLEILRSTNSSFQINLHPYYAWYFNRPRVSLPFAVFNATQDETIEDEGFTYHNLFDVLYDGVRVALDKAGYSDMPVSVGETGWPSFGGAGASVENAHWYNNHLIRHVRSGGGTPRVPNTRIEAFIFEAFDEPNAPVAPPSAADAPPFQPQPFFGINYEVGKPKYTLNWNQV